MSRLPQILTKNTALASLLCSIAIAMSASLSMAEKTMDSLDALTAAISATENKARLGRFPDAILSGKKTLELGQNTYGPTHPSIVPLLNRVGVLYRHMAQYPEAEQSLKWGLAIRERSLPAGDPLIAESLDQLASLYSDWGRWEEAEFYEKKAAALLEGVNRPALCVGVLNGWGSIESNLGRYAVARVCLERSLALQENAKTLDPSLRIGTLTSLAGILSAQGKPSEAETRLQSALAAAKKAYHPDAFELADAMENLADFYSSHGQGEKAWSLYQDALSIFQKYVGVNYSYESLPYLKKLSQAYQSVGKNKEAKDLMEKSLGTTKEVYGSRHPLTAMTLYRLARIEESMGDKAKAKQHLTESLSISLSYFSKGHPLVKATEKLLGK